jgi:RNA polymerase sigma-70 factor (ECF subfamily)
MLDSSLSSIAGEEAALLQRLRLGEDAAFSELVQTYGPRLLAVLQRY